MCLRVEFGEMAQRTKFLLHECEEQFESQQTMGMRGSPAIILVPWRQKRGASPGANWITTLTECQALVQVRDPVSIFKVEIY